METKYCIRCEEDKPLDEFREPNKRRKCTKCLNEECRLYKQKNKEKISAYNEKYKKEHKDEIKDYNHKYSKYNRVEIQTRQTAYQSNRRKTDPSFKLSGVLRSRIKTFLFGDNRKATRELLGCDYDFVRDWLESQFTDDMTFENHGEVWHIDHVIPCAKFDMTDDDDKHRCFNWTNLQPLLAMDNLRKNDNMSKKEIDNQIKKVKQYIEENGVDETDYMIVSYDSNHYIEN